jgi:hypothetical protein
VRVRTTLLVALSALVLGAAAEVRAWGASGHRWVTVVAMEGLPDELPAFLRAPDTIAQLGELAREPDRSRSAGATHDAERDPGHYIRLDDAGLVAGVIALDALPPTREEYDARLRRARLTQYRVGYLPYAIVDGWQQVRRDFALWRVAAVGARRAAAASDRAWFDDERRLREMLTRRDVGVWSHYVADASQPLHVTVHFNGWHGAQNARAFTTAATLHAWFEGELVRRFVEPGRVGAAMPPYRDCACSVEVRARGHVRTTWATVAPLYELERAGGFREGDPRGVRFAVQRLAAGAAELRDMLVDAWRSSADVLVGHPEVSVRELEAGTVPPRRGALAGED